MDEVSHPESGLTDRLGRTLQIGDLVCRVDRDGTVLWSSSGRVVGLGRTLVHVRWRDRTYDPAGPAKRRYDAVEGARLNRR